MKRTPQQLLLNWYEQMVLCYDSLPEEDKQDLAEFEKKQPTSEWPGWERRIGCKPEVRTA
jgi:hypothetical protein